MFLFLKKLNILLFFSFIPINTLSLLYLSHFSLVDPLHIVTKQFLGEINVLEPPLEVV
jgi:hypothetical protein